MSQPTEIKRVQVLDRVVDVLKAIREGATYFSTPASVEKRYTHWAEVTSGPAYSVSIDSGGKLGDGLNLWKHEEFYINIKGVVLDAEDVPTVLARCLRDVRYAIDSDMAASATAGTLGYLCEALFIEDGAETDNGYLSLEGKGQFEQRIRIVTAGTINTL